MPLKLNTDNKLFLLILSLAFAVFIFTTDGHRSTPDEDWVQLQTMRIVTGQPHPLYVPGESSTLFEHPEVYPTEYNNNRPICQNAILCSRALIGHSAIEVPFVFINHYLHIITKDTLVLTANDFDDPHYIYWRNTQDPDFTFLELFYGPLFSALSAGVFFLVCRTFDFSRKNAITLTFLYGFTTMMWAYSKTSLNSVPLTFFVLLGFLYFRKFQNNHSTINLIVCGTSLGFAFLVRLDAALFIIPLFFFLLFDLRKQNEKIRKFLSFVVPVVLFYIVHTTISFIRYGISPASATIDDAKTLLPPRYLPTLLEGIVGLLLSPGVGLFIFVPVLFTIFFSFPDFYRRNKSECFLILSFIGLFLFYYGAGIGDWWHGLAAWGPRYLLPIIPFLLLPLGASIANMKNKFLKISLVVLGGLGFFFNIVYMIQDVIWFVWGYPGRYNSLFSLSLFDPLYIHPTIIWTFEHSQLTQSIITASTHLQPDMYLLKLLGPTVFGLAFTAIIVTYIFLLFHLLRKTQDVTKKTF